MVAATLTSKGQITIPAEVREALGLARGDRVVFERTERGYLMTASPRHIDRLAGFFGPYEGTPVTVEQMNEAIAAEASDANR
jgi:AbrB family looped-hinge helix DNA binding protein